MSTLSVQTITDVQSFDFSNTEFAGAYNASNAAFNSANLSYNAQNVVFAVANASYASVNSNWTVTNTVYSVANAGYNSINSNWTVTNTVYGVANASYASVNSNWTVTNTVYSVANAAFAAANNVGPQIAPTYNTANAAFAAANSKVATVSGTGTVSGLTLSGTVTTTGNLTLGGTLSASIIDNISDEHRLFNNMGDNHSTRTSFDATNPSYNFGWRFIVGSTNGPGVNGAGQYYSLYAGLGNDYLATGAGSYGMQMAFPRNVTTPYIAIRYNENNTLGSWQKISAGYADTVGTITSGQVTTALGSRGIQKASMPAGSILQVQSTTLTSTFTTAATTYTDLTGMSVSITPTSATSRILVQVSLNFQGDASTQGYCQIDRNGTAIAIGDANGSRVRFTICQYVNQQNEAPTTSMTFLDSPATTSALTYKLQLRSQGTGTIYVNRSTAWAADATSGTGISTITVYEVAV